MARRLADLTKHAMEHLDKFPQAASEGAAWLAAGAPLASEETRRERQLVCDACEHWKPIGQSDLMHCAVCKCPSWKLALATAACPLAKW